MNVSKRRETKQEPRATWLAGFYGQECCGVPMQSGYDVMTYACRHNEYEDVTDNVYYIVCNVCGTTETLCEKCVAEAVLEAQS